MATTNATISIASDIMNYVDGGGIAAISLCAQGHTGDFGGIVTTTDYPSYNTVVNPDHPLMAGVENPFQGNSPSHNSFTSVFHIRKLSALVSPSGQETIIPVQVFACVECKHINSDFLPKN